MLDLIIFILSTIGITLIITQSYIFKGTRNYILKKSATLGKLISCSQCVGFYIGLIVQLIIIIHDKSGFYFNVFDLYYLLYGPIGSLVSYTFYLLIKPHMDKYD